MSLTYGGNLGLGITNPSQRLNVQGISTFSDDAFFSSDVFISGNLTISSLCFLQPMVNEIIEVGNIKYMSVSWNSCDVKNVNSIYGDNIISTGNNMQWIAQTPETVKPKLSNILCMKPNVSICIIKASFIMWYREIFPLYC